MGQDYAPCYGKMAPHEGYPSQRPRYFPQNFLKLIFFFQFSKILLKFSTKFSYKWKFTVKIRNISLKISKIFRTIFFVKISRKITYSQTFLRCLQILFTKSRWIFLKLSQNFCQIFLFFPQILFKIDKIGLKFHTNSPHIYSKLVIIYSKLSRNFSKNLENFQIFCNIFPNQFI